MLSFQKSGADQEFELKNVVHLATLTNYLNTSAILNVNLRGNFHKVSKTNMT